MDTTHIDICTEIKMEAKYATGKSIGVALCCFPPSLFCPYLNLRAYPFMCACFYPFLLFTVPEFLQPERPPTHKEEEYTCSAQASHARE